MTDDRFTTYKVARGEKLEERVGDLEGLLRMYFGGSVSATNTAEIDGKETECLILEGVDVDGLNRVIAGIVSYPGKKSRLAVRFVETHPLQLSDGADPSEAVQAKNDFLHAATGRTAEDRRKSWENSVED